MGVWKDKNTGTWKFKFQMSGKVYGGGGHKTRKVAISAREQRKIDIKENASTGALIQTGMAFSEITNLYLDASARRHAPKTYRYKKLIYKLFTKHIGDLPIDQVTPRIVQDYLTTRKTNSNYNRHRKDLGALFTFARKTLQVIQHNPCDVVE